jgi:hypothetical protein
MPVELQNILHIMQDEIKNKVGIDTAKCLRKIEHSVFGDLL